VNVGGALGDAGKDEEIYQLDHRSDQAQILASFGGALGFGLLDGVFDQVLEVADLANGAVILVNRRQDVEFSR